MDERIARAIIGAIREHDRSGYEIWQWLGPRHGQHEQLTEPTLYPLLYELEAERVIQGEWREGRPTRRLYRVAARGADMAANHGWPVLAKLRPEERPAAEHPTVRPAAETQAGDAAADSTPEQRAAARAAGLIEEYVARMDSGLRLSEAQRNLVRIEIGDHLEDAAGALSEHGVDPESAASEAIGRLGPPEVMAEAISKAQLTRRRLSRGLGLGLSHALVGGGLGLAAGAVFVLLAPLAGRALTTAAAAAGWHLYIPETGTWREQQSMAACWVGAFMAARRSTRRVALYTRRAERDVQRMWALLGAGILSLVALLLPGTLDLFSAIGLIGIPVAFVVGTWQAEGQNDDPVSKRGVAAAAVLLAAFLFAPGFRVWVFDASAGTPTTPAASGSIVRLDWENHLDGTLRWSVYVTGLDTETWHDVTVEFWPTARHAAWIDPDPNSPGPVAAISPGDMIDLAQFQKASPDLWVTVTAAGSDGQRRALTAEVHLAATDAAPQNLIGWLFRGR